LVEEWAGPETRSYTTVPLNRKVGKYQLRIYPTKETEDTFSSNKKWVYTLIVLFVFGVTSIVLFWLDRTIAHRNRIVMERMVKTAEDATRFERSLNEFLAHEVRK